MMPILYSFRRCPYAIRARMSLCYAQVKVELREVVFRNKPQAMLDASSKGTVPTLVLEDGCVIDESKDIMYWALAQQGADTWLVDSQRAEIDALFEGNDGAFKAHLDHYKYADRYPEFSAGVYRKRGEAFLQNLEQRLQQSAYLLGDKMCLADVAIFPFIRQFAMVDKAWFDQSDYKQLQYWLQGFLESELFTTVMSKYPAWQKGDDITVFPA